jgi:hypothetical protein
MADKFNQQTIYVETDYDNIILIDPNKIVVGNEVQDRLVNHEDLVFYANLEARVIPRTKLAVGESFDSPVVNTIIASIQGQSESFEKLNFLIPKGKSGFDTSWADQFTGKGSRQGNGSNQTGERFESKDGTVRAFRNVRNYEDTQALGIKSISINIKPNAGPGGYIPDVRIRLTDVGGKTLFEQGENSIYSTFFNLPYPQFYLTIKGYYGKAIRYTLFMTDFSARFDDNTGNFEIDLTLTSNLVSLLQDTPLTYAKTAPKMFPILINSNGTSNNSVAGNNVSANNIKEDFLGRQILNQVYSEYEAKKLIPEGFPRLSIDQFINRTDDFESQMKQDIQKGDFVALNDVRSFNDELDEIKNRNYTVLLDRYLDSTNFVSYNNEIYYQFKQTIPLQKRNEIENAIKAETKNSVEILQKNETFKPGGTYKVGTKTYPSEIPVKFPEDEIFFKLDQSQLTDTDFSNTYQARYGRTPSSIELQGFKVQVLSQLVISEKRLDPSTGAIIDEAPTFIKYGIIDPINQVLTVDGFLNRVNTYKQELKAKEQEIETNFSNELSDRVTRTDGTIGFKPTIRNVFAIIMAGCDTFYRLMDKTHVDSWNKRNDPLRIKTIIPAEKSNTVESKNVINYADGKLNEQNVVYPWPSYYVLEKQQDNREMYTVRYLGDPKYASKTFAFTYDIWPEIFFTENFLDASVRRASSSQQNAYQNLQNLQNFATVNALEFPFNNKPYATTTELNVFYEIFERMYVLSNYSNILKKSFDPSSLQADTFISHIEGLNVINSITENFILQEKLKNTAFNYENSLNYLKTLSNGGTSKHWLNLERGIFNTPYLDSLVKNSFGLYSKKSIDGYTLALENNDPLAPKFKEYVEKIKVDDGLVISEKGLTFLDDIKVLARLKINDYYENILSAPYLEYIIKNSKSDILINPTTNGTINTLSTLTEYLENFNNINFTYEFIGSTNYSGNVVDEQITSVLNTPYFVNALQKGVNLEKSGNTDSYVALGYMYLSSFSVWIPNVQYLYDKNFNTYPEYIISNDSIISKLDEYEYSQILQIGAYYHRYKKFIETGEDILSGVFEDFDYKTNYDPTSKNLEKLYKIKNYTGGSQDFICQFKKIDATDNTKYTDIINTGFYPKLISDIHYYFTGKDLFTGYTETEFTNAYTAGTLNIGINTNASYIMPNGGDITNPKRSILLNSYYSYLTFDKKTNIDGQNKIHILTPSNGGIPLNQASYEFFKNNKLTYEITNSNELFNGSVRCLWGEPNYGYFPKKIDVTSYSMDDPKVTPDGYFVNRYFLPFRKEMLDKFEELFLGFCKKNPKPSDVLILDDDVTDPSYFSSGGITPLKNRKLFEQILSIFSVNDASSPLSKTQQNNDGLSLATTQKKNNTLTFANFSLNNPIIFKNGNPTNFNRQLFTSLTTINELKNLQPIVFNPYIKGTLPGDGVLTGPNALQTSLTLNTQNVDAWKSLQMCTYLEDTNVYAYTNTGSPVTDFFWDMNIEFNKENVETCQELIKRYATQKAYKQENGETYNKTDFINYINDLLQSNLDIQKNLTNQIFSYINSKLPGVSLQTNLNQGRIDGNINKLSVYTQLQTFNNRWVAGSDLTTRTLFEDFLFMNTANSDIGDQLQLDLKMVVSYLKMEKNVTIADLIGYILNDDKTCLFYATPSYVNFNGIQDAINYDKPIDIDIPNSLFGTYTNVNYLDSRQKFIILYGGKTSEHPALGDNRDVVYGDDSFDIRNQSDCPIRIPQTPDTNYYKTNKIVGFNVDFGIRNQNMFKTFGVGMGNEKQTLVTFKVNEKLAKSSSGTESGQETQSMYSYYKSLSYNIDVKGLGNAMIQPLMYFNLRHVPLFYGPYQILEVEHNIIEGSFETRMKGIRIPKYALPDVDSVSTFIKKNYLEKYKEEILKTNNEDRYQADVVTILDPQNQANEPTTAPEDECNKLTNAKYKTLPYVNNKVENISIGELVTKIKDKQSYLYARALILLNALTRVTNLIDNRPFDPKQNSTLKDDTIISSLNYNLFLLTANNVYADNPELSSLTCMSFPDGAVPLFNFTNVEGGLGVIDGIYGPLSSLTDAVKTLFNDPDEKQGYGKAISSLLISSDTAYLAGGTRSGNDIYNFITTNLTNKTLSQDYFDTLVKLAVTCIDKF